MNASKGHSHSFEVFHSSLQNRPGDFAETVRMESTFTVDVAALIPTLPPSSLIPALCFEIDLSDLDDVS